MNVKIVTKRNPQDTEVYFDGVKQGCISALSFATSVDDFITELHVIYLPSSIEVEGEMDVVDFSDEKESFT